MHPAPLLILSALGVTGLVLTATGKAGATGNAPGPKPKASASSQKSGKTPSASQEQDDMSVSLKKDIAKVIQDLTIDPSSIVAAADGTVTAATVVGPVTAAAVQAATALAAELDRQGFPIAAKTIRDLANLASKRIPSPAKDKQIPLPAQCFTSDEQTALTKAASLERDPTVLQQLIDALTAKGRAAPAECRGQISAAVDMLTAIKHQAEAKAAEDAALKHTETILNAPDNQIPPFVPGIPDGSSSPNAPQPSSLTRVTVVQPNDGFIKITRRLLGAGSDAHWTELRNANLPHDADGRSRKKDTDAKGGIAPMLQPGQKLFVPAAWPVAPGVVVPAPLPPPTPAATPAVSPSAVQPSPSGSGPAVVVIRHGEGLMATAQRVLGASQGAAKWKELRARNVPVNADGKAQKVASDGNFSPPQQPGDRLFVPETWPVSPGTVIGFAPEEDAVEMVAPKSDQEMAAESLCEHLLRLQAKRPDTLGKGREDPKKILRFRHKAGMSIAPNVTPEVLIRAAECGVSRLPIVTTWPEATREALVEYKARLLAMAKDAEENGDHERALNLVESAKREHGQAAGLLPDAAEAAEQV